ncbi:MAG: hypothetical protein ACK55I_00815, partial [bacterium]
PRIVAGSLAKQGRQLGGAHVTAVQHQRLPTGRPHRRKRRILFQEAGDRRLVPCTDCRQERLGRHGNHAGNLGPPYLLRHGQVPPLPSRPAPLRRFTRPWRPGCPASAPGPRPVVGRPPH